jgi:peptide/nickel transport system substrate-binding protein
LHLPVRLTPGTSAALLVALATSLAGCLPTSSISKSPAQGANRLVVASRNRVASVDPAGAYTFGAMQLLSAVGDPLYAVTASGQLEPRLALAPPRLSPDGRTATIPLRRGVRFHDGTPFDAAAMVFSLERFLAIGKLSYLLGDRVEAVRAVDSHTLELRLRQPFAPLAELLSAVALTPLSPTAYRQHGRRLLNERFVGTGPYRLTFYSKQQQRLEPFADYWGPPPANDGIDLVSLSNSTALFGALISGEVDLLLSTSLEIDQQAALRQRSREGQLLEGSGPALEISYLTLLSDQPPFDNPVLRRALAYSLDRDTISERVTLGLRPPLRELVPPSLPGSDPTAWVGYDPDRARSLYRQAGYCQGQRLRVPLTFRSNIPSDRLFALTWQAQLRQDLGDCVQLDVTGMESTTAYRQLGEGAFTLILLDWMGDFPDADNYLIPLLACEKEEENRCLEGASAASGSFWAQPGLQTLLQRSESSTGPERTSLLQRIQRITAGAGPYIPLWLVAPRAWAQPDVSPPSFDGSGRLELQSLTRRRAGVETDAAAVRP